MTFLRAIYSVLALVVGFYSIAWIWGLWTPEGAVETLIRVLLTVTVIAAVIFDIVWRWKRWMR